MKLSKILIGSILAVLTFASANSLNDVKETEVFAKFEKQRPGNFVISKDGRLFATNTPLINPETKVFELSAMGTAKPYPNDEFSHGKDSIIKATIGIRIDANNNLWVLDLGARQFIVWNIEENKINKIIKIPADVTTSTSFLQDFVLDEKRNRVIIADMTQGDLQSAPTPAFVVIDMDTGKASRVAQNHPSMMPEIEGGFALNPIAIDPNFEWLYFGAMHSKKVYRVKASFFDNEKEVAKNIKYYAPKSYSDGMTVDKGQNLYITDVINNAIGFSNDKDGYKIIAKVPKGSSWPDGLVINEKDGYLYGTVDQLNRTAALSPDKKDESTAPFLIVRTELIK
ncbi:L-dopachrome tautomerase-related protein [Poseidonibacter ostreae]|uniref:Gluconolactonase n=1 Tax=Poseidonibacter ostreae TaxID=2654171 RepID=A0A6L4WVB6_9BACT|nr:L-dopachrome tautomerase-related protein [Poseidonibacter ostreae]KAB7888862.1 hypothetical protein GBG18_12155 [Poseidonibacter ostreae]KAB7889647.1 hypothetical protein GBG19_05415 [Poseidonibacter ostreae]